MIFDIDGTLVDTNPSHVEACPWRSSASASTSRPGGSRSRLEKGGDKLVPSVLGQELEDRLGEALRRAQKEEFLQIAEQEHFLQATMISAGIDLPRLAGVRVTKDDTEASKPAPDLIVVACEKVAVSPTDCAMVGDTVDDGQACQAAGVVFLGVLSGCSTESELLQAGACAVWHDTGHLYADLDRALEIASLAAAASE
jgi:HAD superfamily hydrolase (TIGR01509 family)